MHSALDLTFKNCFSVSHTLYGTQLIQLIGKHSNYTVVFISTQYVKNIIYNMIEQRITWTNKYTYCEWEQMAIKPENKISKLSAKSGVAMATAEIRRLVGMLLWQMYTAVNKHFATIHLFVEYRLCHDSKQRLEVVFGTKFFYRHVV